MNKLRKYIYFLPAIPSTYADIMWLKKKKSEKRHYELVVEPLVRYSAVMFSKFKQNIKQGNLNQDLMCVLFVLREFHATSLKAALFPVK